MNSDLLLKVLGDKWLRLVVTLLVLAALAHQISLVVWQFVPQPAQSSVQSATGTVNASSVTDSGANFQQQASAIGKAFLFGKVEQRKVVVQQAEEAPQTQLNYKLRGIYFSPENRLASAIVEVKPNKSNYYVLDDELDENIILAGIEQDHILINRYGKIERLNLEKRLPSSGRTAGVGLNTPTSTQAAALLRSYKNRYTSNPMALATRFQAIPVQQDGKNIGFKLKALRGESLLKKLKFQPNDVFTAVNGVSLKNPFEALDAMKSLTTANDISVTFLRNGNEQTLDFRI